MKVKTTMKLAVEGMLEVEIGTVFDVLREHDEGRGRRGVWVLSPAGKETLLLRHEHVPLADGDE